MGQSRLGTVPVKNSVSFASIRVIRGLNHPLQRFFKTGLPSSMYMNRMTFAQALPMAQQHGKPAGASSASSKIRKVKIRLAQSDELVTLRDHESHQYHDRQNERAVARRRPIRSGSGG